LQDKRQEKIDINRDFCPNMYLVYHILNNKTDLRIYRESTSFSIASTYFAHIILMKLILTLRQLIPLYFDTIFIVKRVTT